MGSRVMCWTICTLCVQGPVGNAAYNRPKKPRAIGTGPFWQTSGKEQPDQMWLDESSGERFDLRRLKVGLAKCSQIPCRRTLGNVRPREGVDRKTLSKDSARHQMASPQRMTTSARRVHRSSGDDGSYRAIR